jgi:hydroxymethylglutaryl-CoA reductase (NADPH)
MHDDILARLQAGTLALHQLETLLSPADATAVRRQFVEQTTGLTLQSLAPLPFDAATVHGRNIENLIGSVSIPVGVAGPITVTGSHARGSYYVPLATTEGALVASINRGCKLLTQSGGVTASLDDHGITRAPLFEARDIKSARTLLSWVGDHQAAIAEMAEATSSHLKWLGMETHMMGRLVWIRMRFGTDEAMGMNMATIAASAVCELVVARTGVQLLALSGNLCADKKPSQINIVAGRGYSVQAEANLPADLIERVLHTDYRRLARVSRAKNWYGSGLGGAIGANAQAANVVAAVFIATGQDAAHIVDSSTCFTVVEADNDMLNISVTLPNILVGSVGGGTGLVAQHTARRLMTTSTGRPPTHSESRRLAEVLAATVLAGEISLLGALSAGHLAGAHRALARGPVR